jgi:hypothetical protein
MTSEQEAEAVAILAYMLATARQPTTPPTSPIETNAAGESDEADPDDAD